VPGAVVVAVVGVTWTLKEEIRDACDGGRLGIEHGRCIGLAGRSGVDIGQHRGVRDHLQRGRVRNGVQFGSGRNRETILNHTERRHHHRDERNGENDRYVAAPDPPEATSRGNQPVQQSLIRHVRSGFKAIFA
jgi:hypothetical protein